MSGCCEVLHAGEDFGEGAPVFSWSGQVGRGRGRQKGQTRAQPLPLVASIKLGTLEGLPRITRRKVDPVSTGSSSPPAAGTRHSLPPEL